MEHTRIPLQAYIINHPENETQADQEDDGDTTILEAGTGDSPNP
jgi:hypothetical protein